MYRSYEDPYKLSEMLEQAKQQLLDNPYDEDLAIEVVTLTERLNFAWQDDEAEMYGVA